MGLVPVNLSVAYTSTLKANLSDAFKFSPFSGAILFTKTHNISDSPTDGYRFDILNLAYYLKMHAASCHLSICLLCIKCTQVLVIWFPYKMPFRLKHTAFLYNYHYERNGIACQGLIRKSKELYWLKASNIMKMSFRHGFTQIDTVYNYISL